MQDKEYTEFLRSRDQTGESIRSALEYVREFEKHLVSVGKTLETAQVADVREYAAALIADNRNSMERLLALARYIYMAGLNETFIYFTAIIGGREVLPSIAARLASITDEKTRDKVFDGIDVPPLGSPPEKYPEITALLVDRLKDLGMEVCHDVLAANHHGVPVESFEKHKKWRAEAGSVDAFLKRVHEEAVGVLERYMNEGKVWYEQEITPEVVEFVRGNQEVLSAVREGGYLYVTKIPYAPKEWLRESDPMMRRYYACHCPLARAAILMGRPGIPMDWCYCSGGFEKLMFDVVFEEPTKVEVLESVLAGDARCRFRIKMPEGRL